jgi:transcription-repair coupling factor (superfamily II helicase)
MRLKYKAYFERENNPLAGRMIKPSKPTEKQPKIRWDGLSGLLASFEIANTVKTADALTVLITPDQSTASQLEYELRFFLNSADLIWHFPDWETLPYDLFSPHHDIVSERLALLSRLKHMTEGVLIVSMPTLFNRLAPVSFLNHSGFCFKTGDTLNIDTLSKQLVDATYHRVDQVFEHGEFAIRGSIVDLFPMGSESPYRLELFDDCIETIRSFNPETQRTIEKISEMNCLPAKEFPFDDAAIIQFRQNWVDRFEGNPMQCATYKDTSKHIVTPGIEYYLPLFFDETASLIDYLPDDSVLIHYHTIHESADRHQQDIKDRHDQLSHDIARPILRPDEVFWSTDALFKAFKGFKQIQIKGVQVESSGLADLSIDHKTPEPLKKLDTFLKATTTRVLFAAETKGRKEALLRLLNDINISPDEIDSWPDFLSGNADVGICVFPLESGKLFDDLNISIITESQLFGQRVLQRRRRKKIQTDSESAIKNLVELKPGDPVVHINHGVGRYQGLETIHAGDMPQEFLVITYQADAKIYVPIDLLHLISRYSGTDIERAPLHSLASDKWQKAKKKAQAKIYDVAAELLAIYAKRQAEVGFAFKLNTEYEHFANGFAFEETPDQEKAIDEVLSDMQNTKPMDRLVCGDVGFGKTEVAMRAAFVALSNEKQVAILAPTTLLTEQHYQTFTDRFADWPVNIAVLSRFKSAKEQAVIIEKLKLGKIDIVIGTHKLLSKDIGFKDLGLLVIDEEHRFGVRQKEKLNKARGNCDLLALTATPIPRSLNMAFSGIRDFSIIATPPLKRLAVKTFIHKRQDQIVKEAISREVLRGGQVYYLHNNVDTIEKAADDLRALLPDCPVGVGHGQLHERELERVMSDFYHRRFHVLVCTTIIETGIDIPSANTILIDRADKFGLAQLHQLRGRVGRSHHQAYAYLFVPDKAIITRDAEKRLDVIGSHEALGIGFTLATHDLEIRGAGELLGEEQSGHMHEIGFNLFMSLLDRAVSALKQGKSADLNLPEDPGCIFDIHIAAIIPEDYLADIHARLVFYKRIASASSSEELHELQVEMVDRYGLLPEPLQNLFRISDIKLKATRLGITQISVSKLSLLLTFIAEPHFDPMKLINLVKDKPSKHQFVGQLQFKIRLSDNSPLTIIQDFFDAIT